MIFLLLSALIFVIGWILLVVFATPIGTNRYSFPNIWHKALYALVGIAEVNALGWLGYAFFYDIVSLIIDNWLNAIWIGVVMALLLYVGIRFHTWIVSVVDLFFGA